MSGTGCEHPPCPICGGPVERRPNERPDKWLRRQTCSPEHTRELQKTSAARRDPDRSPPACVSCGTPIVRRDDEPVYEWSRRKTCGPDCLRALRAVLVVSTTQAIRDKYAAAIQAFDHPPCVVPGCGKPVEIRDGEMLFHFRRRKTCSPECLKIIRSGPRSTESARKARSQIKSAGAAKSNTAVDRHWRHRKTCLLECRKSAPSRQAPTFETVEQALARGLKIKRLPPAFAAASNAAVR